MVIRTQAHRDRVSKLGRQVRQIKERRNLTYAQIGQECNFPVQYGEMPSGWISGLCNSSIIRSDLEPYVADWVKKNADYVR